MTLRLPGFEAQFALILERLYELPMSNGGWAPALTAIADFLGASAADLSFFDPRILQVSRWETARIDTEAMRRYSVDYMTEDMAKVHPRVPVVMRMREGELKADSDVWSLPEQNRMTYFGAFYRSMLRSEDCLMALARSGNDGRPWLVFTQHYDSVPQREARRRLAALLPHIRRTCGMDERLTNARRQTAALSETLDRMTEAAVLIDGAGRVKHANRAASLVFGAGDGLSLAHDARVVLANQDARDAFLRALGQSGSPLILLSTDTTSPPLQIAVPRSKGRPLLLTLQPLPQAMKGALGAVATLFISDPDAKPTDRTAALRTAYRLSPTEVRVAQAMVEGESIKAFAIRNEMSYETARTHLRRVLEKTGTRRQSGLVRLIQTLR